eukprot:5195543-Prymnesium_polylepis.1
MADEQSMEAELRRHRWLEASFESDWERLLDRDRSGAGDATERRDDGTAGGEGSPGREVGWTSRHEGVRELVRGT